MGEWANEIVIKAAAWFFEIDILVIKEDTNYPIYGSPIGGEEHIRDPHMALVFLDDCHFQSVHRVTNGGGNIKQSLQPETKPSQRSVYANLQPFCQGCGAAVKQRLDTHLAQNPGCRRHYSNEESVYASILPCRGCGSVVKQINKHLAKKPGCKGKYSKKIK